MVARPLLPPFCPASAHFFLALAFGGVLVAGGLGLPLTGVAVSGLAVTFGLPTVWILSRSI